jgi:hypothetical protein
MNLLDENIRHDQGERLRQAGIRFRFLSHDLGRSGLQDPEIIPLLHHAKRPTFFTHDRDYFKRDLLHPTYCLAWLDVFDGDAAQFIRRFLRQPLFKTHARRLGKVVRIHPGGVSYWETGKRALQATPWG